MAEDVTAEQMEERLSDARLREVLYESFMDKALSAVVPFAQARTPVLTGATWDSESHRVEAGGLRGYLQANTIYSPFVHNRVPFFVRGVADAQAAIRTAAEEAGLDYFEQVIE